MGVYKIFKKREDACRYLKEERVKAIAIYIKYDKSITDVIRELGYQALTYYKDDIKGYGANNF